MLWNIGLKLYAVSVREEPVRPVSGGEEPVRPVSGGEEPVRPMSGGEEPVRPVSGGEKLKAQTPIFFWEGRGREAQAPQQPLFLLLKGPQRSRPPPALPPLSEEPAAPPALPPLSEEPAAPPALEEDELLFPPPPSEGDELLFLLPSLEELEQALPPAANREEELWPLPPWPEVPALLAPPKVAFCSSFVSPRVAASRGSAAAAVASRGSAAAAVTSRGSAAAAVAWGRPGSCFAWGRPGSCFAWGRPGSCFAWGCQGSCCAWGHYTMAGALRRGAAGHEERGGGQETSSPSRTFAAGDCVAGAPEEGAAGHEELGGVGPPTMATPMDTVLPPLPGLCICACDGVQLIWWWFCVFCIV
ncbi:UNVERIFIED_CONTAM: hypothetical protein FKN15_025136 [Acipenser sinensis]